jgi:hypothetical protein
MACAPSPLLVELYVTERRTKRSHTYAKAMKTIQSSEWKQLLNKPRQIFHMLGQEGLDGKVKLRSVSYAGPPGDPPLVQVY